MSVQQFSIIGDNGKVLHEWQRQVCFWPFKCIEDKKDSRFVHYKPTLKDGIKKEEALLFLNIALDKLRFNKWIEQTAEEILETGVYIPTTYSAQTILVLLTLVRYVEEFPEFAKKFIELATVKKYVKYETFCKKFIDAHFERGKHGGSIIDNSNHSFYCDYRGVKEDAVDIQAKVEEGEKRYPQFVKVPSGETARVAVNDIMSGSAAKYYKEAVKGGW